MISEGASVEEAVSKAAAKATKTLRNVTAVTVENIKELVGDGKVEGRTFPSALLAAVPREPNLAVVGPLKA